MGRGKKTGGRTAPPLEGQARSAPVPKLRCSECGKRYPEQDTVLVNAKLGGDYRRAPRSGHKRVCRDCTEAHIAFTRQQNEQDLASPVNTRIRWEQAARTFGIDMSGLLLDRMTGRREP